MNILYIIQQEYDKKHRGFTIIYPHIRYKTDGKLGVSFSAMM